MSSGLLVTYPLFFPILMKIEYSWHFRKMLEYQISR